jgi:DNA replication protein DnaC
MEYYLDILPVDNTPVPVAPPPKVQEPVRSWQELMASLQQAIAEREAQLSPEERQARYDAAQTDRLYHERERQRQERQRQEEYWESHGVHRKFYNATWDNFRIELIPADTEYARLHNLATAAILDNMRRALSAAQSLRSALHPDGTCPRNTIFVGRYGTGKDHLAACLAKEGATLINTPMLLEEMAISSQLRYDRIQSLSRVPLLILDEFGRYNATEARHTWIFHVVNLRWEQELPTLVISNLSQRDVLQSLGAPLVERMQPLSIVPFYWASRRGVYS